MIGSLTADKAREMLRSLLGTAEVRVDAREAGDYVIIETSDSVRASMRYILPSIVPMLVFRIAAVARPSRTALRYKSYLAIHRAYGSVDAACIAYVKRKLIRLMCAGRPNAVDVIVEITRPHTLAVPYDPSPLRVCAGKTTIMYVTREGGRLYFCRVIDISKI